MSELNYVGKIDTDNSLATKSLFDSRVNGYLTQEELRDTVSQRFLEKALIQYVTLQDNRSVKKEYFDQILKRKIGKSTIGLSNGIAPLEGGKVPLRFLKEGPRMPYTWGAAAIPFGPAQVMSMTPVQVASVTVRDPGYLYYPFFFGTFSVVGLTTEAGQNQTGQLGVDLIGGGLEALLLAQTGISGIDITGLLSKVFDVLSGGGVSPGFLEMTVRAESSTGTVLASGATDDYHTAYSGVRSGSLTPSVPSGVLGLTPHGYDRDLTIVLSASAPTPGSAMLLTASRVSTLLFPVFTS